MNKKTITSKKLGFSLIELSVVILVIGLVVIGITKGSRIMTQAKLKSAQSLTTSSPVASISGISIWLEATDSDNFLSAETSDGANLTTWNDANPQTTVRNNVSRGTSNSNITYAANGINNLPSISFNGTAGATNVLTGSVISAANNNFTFFVVSQAIPVASTFQVAFENGISFSGFGYQIDSTIKKRDFVLYNIADNLGSLVTSNPEIASGTYNGNNISLFINGAADALTPNTGTMISPTGSLLIGNGFSSVQPWKGFIGEIIIFSRNLTTSERRSVEQYLGNKWGIKVS